MKKFLTTAVIFMCALGGFVNVAHATDMTTCGTITAPGYYRLTANLSVSSTNCLTITGLNAAAYAEIDCAGHSITNTGVYDTNWAIYAHDNNGGVKWHNCKFYGSRTDVKIENTGNYSLDPGSYGYNNEYHNTTGQVYPAVLIFNSLRPTLSNEHVYDKVLGIYGSSRPIVTYNTVDLANVNSGDCSGMIILIDSDYHYTRYNTLKGDPSVAHCDDGVVVQSTNSAGGYGGSIVGNEIRNVWDAPVEVVGKWSNLTVTDNSYYNFGLTGFGCYYAYGCSLDGLTYSRNTGAARYTGTFLLLMTANNSGQLTNSTFSDNTMTYIGAINSGGGPSATFGSPSLNFATAYNNYVSGNRFGYGANVVFQNTTAFTDGGSNYCLSASPAAITCH
jgi:hypothetical protein